MAPEAVLDRRALKRYAGLFAGELADREDIVKLAFISEERLDSLACEEMKQMVELESP